MSCASIETNRSMHFKPEKYTQPLELRKRYPSKSTSKMSELIPFTTVTTPLREFRGHEDHIRAVAVFPDERRMVTGSEDKTLRLWDLKTGVMLKKMVGHSCRVWRLAVSQDGKLIASGDEEGGLIVWHGETGEALTQPIQAHSGVIYSLIFSPDGTMLATGSRDETMKQWNTKTWEQQGDPINCGGWVYCVRYSPSGELLATATDNNIEIYNPATRERVVSFKAHMSESWSLAWTPDGTRLLTSGDDSDCTICEWDTSTWELVGDSSSGHSDYIQSIAVNPAGTLIASASHDNHVRLWRLPDRRNLAMFSHSSGLTCVTFSVDGKHILSGGEDKMISEWAVPQGIHPKARFRP
jgi:WD40 repeat protein